MTFVSRTPRSTTTTGGCAAPPPPTRRKVHTSSSSPANNVRLFQLKTIGLVVLFASLAISILSTKQLMMVVNSDQQEPEEGQRHHPAADLSTAADTSEFEKERKRQKREVVNSNNNNNTFSSPTSPMVFSAADDASSVDYIACCGLGHRLARMAAAYSVARQVNFALRSHWGWCGGDDGIVEVYSTLFEPELTTTAMTATASSSTTAPHANTTTTNPPLLSTKHRIRFLNDVPGFGSLVRTGKTTTASAAACPCDHPTNRNAVRDYYEFYAGLRRRFRHRGAVVQKFCPRAPFFRKSHPSSACTRAAGATAKRETLRASGGPWQKIRRGGRSAFCGTFAVSAKCTAATLQQRQQQQRRS